MVSDDPHAEIRASFFIECEELLESLNDALGLIEYGEADDETVNVVFRAAHSIKGGAGAFGLDDLVAFAHSYETVLDLIRAGKLAADAEVMPVLFAAADVLADLVRMARDGEAGMPAAQTQTMAALAALSGDLAAQEEDIDFQPLGLSLDLDLPGSAGAEGALRVLTIRFRPSAELYASGNEPAFFLQALARLGHAVISLAAENVPALADWQDDAANLEWTVTLETDEPLAAVEEVFDFVADICVVEITEDPPAPDEPAPVADVPGAEPPPRALPVAAGPADDVPQARTVQAKPARPQATVRVELGKIDRLMNLVGELVINQAMLSQSMTEAGIPPNSDLAQGLDEFMHLTRNIQDSVMTIRAQPVKSLFQRMGRIVREASAELGKSVRLRTEGEMTEVDKTVVERLADPLTHMIRNAVDHGLEPPQVRIAAGKTAEGTVTLAAQHQSGRVVIEVADDGGGINRERVREKAVESGLIAADAALSEAEIDDLLFRPGFSTAGQVSALSGRGVGMDVVNTAIQSLGGRIAIASDPGKGTRFTISLPLTLAVLDGMVVQVAGETLVVPLASIVETMILTEKNLRMLDPQSPIVEIRGGYAPVIDLGEALGYRDRKADYTGSIVLVIGADDGSRTTIIVDTILDQRQVVIKGLQAGLASSPGIAAATILGDGHIALILDPIELSHARRRPRPLQEPPLQLTG